MVYVHIVGGLGNQLRIFAAGYAIANILGDELVLDLSSYESGYFRPYALDKLCLPIHSTVSTKIDDPLSLVVEKHAKDCDKVINIDSIKSREELIEILDGCTNVYAYGYGGTYLCNELEKEILKKQIFPICPTKELLTFVKSVDTDNTVSVHVRRTDFIDEGRFNDISLDYIKAAIMYMYLYVENPNFYFFSDDMEWVKESFGIRKEYHYVTLSDERTRDVEELFCIAACHHHILSNQSTYSAWETFFSKDWESINLALDVKDLGAAPQLTLLDLEIVRVLSGEYDKRIGVEKVKKKISIIIPCYNVEKYVSQCLDSIISQTMDIEELEIIIVNDKSTDNTLEVLREYEKKYSNNIILVERDTNGGLSAARNTGLQYASCEYVLFVDSDDYLNSNACKVLYERASKDDYDVVSGGIIMFCGTEVIAVKQYEDVDYNLKNPGDLKKYLLAKGEICSAWANLYKRNFIIENDLEFSEGFLMEDVAFFIDVFNSAKKTSTISECIYMYRSNDEGIMQSKILQGAIDGHALVINRYDKYSGVEWSDVDREAFEWYLFYKGFYTPVGNVLNSDVVCDDDIIYTFAKNILKRIPKYKGNKCIAEMLQMDEGGIAEFLEFVCHTEFQKNKENYKVF